MNDPPIDTRSRPFGTRLLGPANAEVGSLRVRIQVLLTLTIVATNVVGAVSATLLIAFVIPSHSSPDTPIIVANAIAIPLYVALAVGVGIAWGTGRIVSSLRWAIAEREPDEHDQRAALRAPMELVKVQGALWGLATVVFTAINGFLDHELIVTTSVAVGAVGLVTCANTYLFSEFILRPVAAQALATRPPEKLLVPGVTARTLLAWAVGSVIPVVGLMLVAILALIQGDVSATKLSVAIIVLGGVMILVGFLVMSVAVRATVDPIRGLRVALSQVERGDLTVELSVYDGSEVGLLQAGFNRMVEGLRERERLRDLFGRHVGEDVARTAIARHLELGGEVRTVGVLFVDIVGSTALAQAMEPTAVVELLNRFFTVVVDVVDAHGGFVNKFEGDGALAVFGAPVDIDDPAGCALAAGRDLADRLPPIMTECTFGIGIAAGDAVAGNVGTESRFEYTVIGDPVNEAARLTELAKSAPPYLFASWAAVEMAAADEATYWQRGDVVQLRGRSEASAIAHPRGNQAGSADRSSAR